MATKKTASISPKKTPRGKKVNPEQTAAPVVRAVVLHAEKAKAQEESQNRAHAWSEYTPQMKDELLKKLGIRLGFVSGK